MRRTARDRLGRPLLDGDLAAVPGVPERTDIDASLAWQEATAYLAQGLPFHAHEVLEQRWRCAPRAERLVWQGLAQWAAALTHEARGNATGARAVAERARRTIDAGCTSANVLPAGLDADALERVRRSLDELQG